jgi:beta-N-acetylhexosaminidase
VSLGPLMMDLRGPELLPEEREQLRHPAVGGVILFGRNYRSTAQLSALTEAIHSLRHPRLLVAVDQEGGRVQRFRDGFTELPPAAAFGAIHDQNPATAKHLAELGGWLMAAELRAVGVDLSFAPVLDLDYGASRVIGNRAFHAHPEVVATLARRFIAGMRRAGMAAVGKHFPGHGAVAADSHIDMPVDGRSMAAIEAMDLLPYRRLRQDALLGVMIAHVVYPRVDNRPAGFSPVWIEQVLRRRLGFQGAVFSDDLSMQGAAQVGDHGRRALAALDAGCDMVLVCNRPEVIPGVLDALEGRDRPLSHLRLVRLHGRPAPGLARLQRDPRWQQAVSALRA